MLDDILTTGECRFRISLQGGETLEVKDAAEEAGVQHVLGSGEFPLKVRSTSVRWYQKDQHRARSCKYIAEAHTPTGVWVLTIVHLHTQKDKNRNRTERRVELRAFGPMEVACGQTLIQFENVPEDVVEKSRIFFELFQPSSFEARMDILFDI